MIQYMLRTICIIIFFLIEYKEMSIIEVNLPD